MIFFKDYPKVSYTLNKKVDIVTNITSRFKPVDLVLENLKIFYDYTVRDGETPEIVSNKFYDSMEYHWVVMMFNRYLDPYFDWPMADDIFNKYIDEKYGSEAIAKQTIHEYRHILQENPLRFNIIDYNTYLQLDDFERDFIYKWDYEFDRNEKKRQIKIPDSIYISQIAREKENLYI